MTLLSKASFLVTPNGYKEDKLYAAIPTNGNGDMTFTRATTATRVNEAGLVELVPYNLFSRSQEFDNASWLKFQVSVTANALTAPDGTLTADIVTVTSDVGNRLNQAVAVTASTTYTFSFYAKAGTLETSKYSVYDLTNSANILSPVVYSMTGEWQRITSTFTTPLGCTSINMYTTRGQIESGTYYVWGAQLVEGTSALTYQKTVDRLDIPRIDYTGGGCPSILLEPQRTNLLLNSATVVTQTITTTAVANTLSFYGTGTITLSGTFAGTLVGTGASNRVSLTFTPTAGSLVLTVSGSCTNGQLEAGAYPTSYIPTTSSTVTRNADVLSRDNIYTNGLIVGGGGTWFVHLINNTAFTADSNIGAIYLDTSSAGYTNGLMLRKQTAGRIKLQTYVSASGSFIYTTTTDTVKILFKWNGATADVFVNGAKVVSATLFPITNMQYLASNSAIYALIKETMLFPKPLTEAQCIALTTL